MTYRTKILFFLCLVFFWVSKFSWAAELDLAAKQALLIDLTTGEVLYEKNADELVPPSSMSKIMTVYLVFNELKSGRIREQDTFKISERAWKAEGSRTFLNVGSDVPVIDLLRGVIVQSGNDAAIALAEGMAGTEEMFADLMNKKAKELGANTASFKNATGLPDEQHLMSLRDLAAIALRTIKDFPEYYSMYKETDYTYNNIPQQNRNPLLYENIGCDGLKTGHTEAGGYGLVASCVQNGRRLLMVINGCPSKKVRSLDAKNLMTWGLRYFTSPTLFKAGQVVETTKVWMGRQDQVSLVAEQDIAITVPRLELEKCQVEVVYKTPVDAPLKKGEKVGKVIVSVPNKAPQEFPLVLKDDIEKAGFFSRIRLIKPMFEYLVFGK